MLDTRYGRSGRPKFPAPFLVRPSLTPQDILGAKLVGFIDPEDNSRITASSGTVAAYSDLISSASYAQASAPARPLIATNAVTGRQVFRGDGTGQFLEFTGIPSGIPTGANPGEIIAIVSQAAPVASDTQSRNIFTYGGTGSSGNRILRRSTNLGLDVVSMSVGIGSDNTVAQFIPSVLTPFLSNHLVRGIISGTTVNAGMDGVNTTAVAAVPSTATTRARICANSANTASSFWWGDLMGLLLTNAILTDAEFNAIAVWAGPRIWG